MVNMTLNGILEACDRDDVTEAEQIQLRSLILEKVDHCALFDRQLESEVERLEGHAKEFVNASKSAKRRLERFREYVKYAMESKGFERLPGEKFECVLKVNPGKVHITQEPTSWDAEAYPDLVRLKYEWDKTAIKDGLAKKDIPFATIVRDQKVVFAVRKAR